MFQVLVRLDWIHCLQSPHRRCRPFVTLPPLAFLGTPSESFCPLQDKEPDPPMYHTSESLLNNSICKYQNIERSYGEYKDTYVNDKIHIYFYFSILKKEQLGSFYRCFLLQETLFVSTTQGLLTSELIKRVKVIEGRG